MPRSRRQPTAVEMLLQQASNLSLAELKVLLSGIEGLMDAVEGQRDKHGKPMKQKGFIEEKMVNRCGPYRYLRYWDEGKHKSVYLGKVEE